MVCELQEMLASLSNYDLANAIEYNVIGSTHTWRDIRITTIIHGCEVAGMNKKNNPE